jgi:hypothetical protein
VRIAVVGSRDYPRLSLVDAWVRENLKARDVLVSGGARGVDRRAAFVARAMGLEVVEHEADRGTAEREGWPAALLARNTTIVRDADRVVAFWDKASRGTFDAMGKAWRLGKPLECFGPDGERIEPLGLMPRRRRPA